MKNKPGSHLDSHPMMIDEKINTLLSRAYILGGSPCSGKSTVAERFIDRYGLQHYKVDDRQDEHMKRCRPDHQPVMWRISKLGWDQLFSRPVPEQVAEELAFYTERFEMILEDLYAFNPEPPVLLEGAAFLPDLIHPYPVDPGHVLYLVPTLSFQRHHYKQRPWINDILKDCEEPKKAFDNWMMRDYHFGQAIIRQATRYGYPHHIVEGRMDINELDQLVSRAFSLID